MSDNTISLKLIGLASYNQPKFFSRIIRRNEIVSGIPADFAGSVDDPDSLLGMGGRDSEGNLIKPTWIKVETPPERRATRPAASKPTTEAAAAQSPANTDEEDPDGDDGNPAKDDDDQDDDTPATSQRSAARKTPSKTATKTAAKSK